MSAGSPGLLSSCSPPWVANDRRGDGLGVRLRLPDLQGGLPLSAAGAGQYLSVGNGASGRAPTIIAAPPRTPGRVVTLIPSPGARCGGMAYEVEHTVFEHLDHREKNGYERHAVDIALMRERFGSLSSGAGLCGCPGQPRLPRARRDGLHRTAQIDRSHGSQRTQSRLPAATRRWHCANLANTTITCSNWKPCWPGI